MVGGNGGLNSDSNTKDRNKYIWHEHHQRGNRFEDGSRSIKHYELVKLGMLLRHQGEMKVKNLGT